LSKWVEPKTSKTAIYAFGWTVEVAAGVIASSLRLRFSFLNQSMSSTFSSADGQIQPLRRH
jgi:hypothetical protein